jgi:hypothetical protein
MEYPLTESLTYLYLILKQIWQEIYENADEKYNK